MTKKNGMFVSIYEGDWDVIVPWPLIIANGALTPNERLAWHSLRYRARSPQDLNYESIDTSNIYPSMDEIADFIGCSKQTASKAINGLKKKGLVEIKTKRRASGSGTFNIYIMKDPKKWWNEKGKKLKKEWMETKGKKYRKQTEALEKHRQNEKNKVDETTQKALEIARKVKKGSYQARCQ